MAPRQRPGGLLVLFVIQSQFPQHILHAMGRRVGGLAPVLKGVPEHSAKHNRNGVVCLVLAHLLGHLVPQGVGFLDGVH